MCSYDQMSAVIEWKLTLSKMMIWSGWNKYSDATSFR